MSIKQAIEEPSDAATKLAELILSDCGHSTAITTALRDRVALRIDKYTDALAALRSMPAEPVAWTLTETLTKRETTTTGYLWFTDPQNSSWTALFATPHTAPKVVSSNLPVVSKAVLSDAEIRDMVTDWFDNGESEIKRGMYLARDIEAEVLRRGGGV